jgi:hypothetical protein
MFYDFLIYLSSKYHMPVPLFAYFLLVTELTNGEYIGIMMGHATKFGHIPHI